ncbi:MAG: TonB-dependent receptor [Williamsia sp.]|nr:TonB-dependent receptor [Williamsia sp.]
MKLLYIPFSLLLVRPALAQPDTAKPASLQEVVVTGQYQAQSLKISVYQIRVVPQARIRLRGASNLQQVLNSEIGFRFSNDNTLGTSDVELMGMGGRNVKILLDGVPLVDRGDTRESLNQVDVNLIERIEIVEGPLSVLYGSDALAGVINVITRKQAAGQFSIRAKAQEETAGSEYYPFSYQGLHQQHVEVTGQYKRWSLAAGGSHYDFNGWGGDQWGRAKSWKPKEQWLGHARLGYETGQFHIYYRLDGLDEAILSKGAIGQTYKALDQRYTTRRYLHQMQSDWSVNERMKLNTILSYTDYSRKTRTTEHDFVANSNQLTSGAGEQDASTVNSELFRATLQNKFSNSFSMQAGFEINREQAGGQRIEGAPVITDYALFVSSEIKPVPAVNIRPGLRFIKNSVYDAPPVVPSINTKISLSKLFDLRMAYAYGFRAPALRELYFNYYDANHNIVGNPHLKAEHSNSYTASLSYTQAGEGAQLFSSTLSAYYNRFRNLINFAVSPSDPQQYTMVNIDQFRTCGVVLENRLKGKNLDATLGVGYLARYNQLAGDAQYKDQSLPRFMWSPEVNTNLAYTFQKAGVQLGLFYKFTGKRPGYQLATTNGQEQVKLTKIDHFHWADLTASKTWFSRYTVSAGIRNLFNIRSINSTAVDNGVAHGTAGPAPVSYGRSGFVSLAFQWIKS